jgi:uncharacterized RDD family membrane protein YckC
MSTPYMGPPPGPPPMGPPMGGPMGPPMGMPMQMMRPDYQGPGLRFVALLIDFNLMAIVVGIFNFIFATIFGGTVVSTNGGFHVYSGMSGVASVIEWLINWAIVFAYLTVLEGKSGQTLGKMALGLRVVNVDGSPVSMGSAAARNILKSLEMWPLL